MKKQEQAPSSVLGILAMNPEKYREIDGVVLDLESYARHSAALQPAPPASAMHSGSDSSAPPAPAAASPATTAPVAPQPAPAAPQVVGVFVADPVHVGWYQTEAAATPYPIMAGPMFPCGSGSGSFAGSYLTSWLLGSGSWLLGSGSWLLGSGTSSSGLCAGYGLELI